MSGLVTRLQKQAERGTYIPDGPKLILEAIAELETLRDKNSQLLSTNYDLRKERDRQIDEIESLRARLDESTKENGLLVQRVLVLDERLAKADKANQLLRADIAAAAREEDLILAALRLDPERYRTECGYLNVPKIVAAIKNPDMYPHIAQPTEVSK